MDKVLAYWKKKLKIKISIETCKISRWEVTGENSARGESLVGVIIKPNKAIIVHTRKLLEEDIIHELLHVANPSWSEEEVKKETNFLMNQKRRELKNNGEWSER